MIHLQLTREMSAEKSGPFSAGRGVVRPLRPPLATACVKRRALLLTRCCRPAEWHRLVAKWWDWWWWWWWWWITGWQWEWQCCCCGCWWWCAKYWYARQSSRWCWPSASDKDISTTVSLTSSMLFSKNLTLTSWSFYWRLLPEFSFSHKNIVWNSKHSHSHCN